MNAAWPHGDPREVARSVLADPRFRPLPPRGKTWWELLGDLLRPWWNRLWAPFDHLTGSESASRVVGAAVLIVVLVLLVYVAVRFVRRLRPRRAERPSVAIDALHAELDARELFARALAAAAEGRHRDAAVLLWSSALRALDERGRVRYDPARTPGEWRRAVRDPNFDALTRDAVAALFAEHGADAPLIARMRASYDRVFVQG